MILIGTLAGASLLMVIAMVQFTATLVADDAPAALRRGWGAAYLLSWIAIGGVIVGGAIETHTPWRDAVAMGALVVGGWGGFHAFWIWLWFGLARANSAKEGTPGPAGARLALAHRCGQVAAVAATAVLLACIQLGFVRAAIVALIAPRHVLLTLTLGSAVVGGMLLIGGGIRLILDRGEPMTAQEIDEDLRRSKFGSRGQGGRLSMRASAYRHFGPAEGARAEQEVSLSALKEAWRSGAWRTERPWQTMFIMTAGGLMMLYGGFGAAVVAGPIVAKVLCGGALAYATFQLVAAARRA